MNRHIWERGYTDELLVDIFSSSFSYCAFAFLEGATLINFDPDAFEMQRRYFMTVLNFGVDMTESTTSSSIRQFLKLDEKTFFEQLYEPLPAAEARLKSYIRAGDLFVYVKGRPGSGKSSLVRFVLASLVEAGHLKHTIVLDFLRDRDGDSTPEGVLRWVQESILDEAWRIYKGDGLRVKSMLALFYLQRHEERRAGENSYFHASVALLGAIRNAAKLFEESVGDEDAQSLRSWFENELRKGSKPALKAKTAIVEAADARDVLYAHACAQEPNAPKVVIFYDNLDSIPRPDTACACRDWIRSNFMPFLDSSVFIAAIRPENAYYLAPASGGDVTAVRYEVLDLDSFAPQYALTYNAAIDEPDGSDYVQQRSELDRRICEKRLMYLRVWYGDQHAALPLEVQGLFGALWASRQIRRIRQDADALSNWNYRVLAASLGTFAIELYLNLRLDWSSIDPRNPRQLTPAEESHIESAYYAWLAGSFPVRGESHFAVQEYNPAEWHWFIAEPDALESSNPRFLFSKGHHITMAAVYNAAGMDLQSPTSPALTSEVIGRMGELGFAPDEVARFIRNLIFPHGRAQRDDPVRLPVSSESAPPPQDNDPWNRFGEERRYLLQAVDGAKLISVPNNGLLPIEIILTDRGRQLLEHIGVKLHFLIGLLDQSNKTRVRDATENVWPDPSRAPVTARAFARLLVRLERMAAFHIKCLEEARELLWARYSEGWLDHLRDHFCLTNLRGARYNTGGNLFFDRLLLSIEKYLERMGDAQITHDSLPSVNPLQRVRGLRQAFGDYVEEQVKLRRVVPPHQRPDWLVRYEQAMVTFRNQRR